MYLIDDWFILYIIGIPENTWKRIEETYGSTAGLAKEIRDRLTEGA